MESSSLSGAASRSGGKQACSRGLREALDAAARGLRRQTKTWPEGAGGTPTESVQPNEVIHWDRDCEFAGQKIDSRSLIYTSQHSFCFLTPRPVVPGHAIACPRRPAKALFNLTQEEVEDLFLATQALSWLLCSFCGSAATTVMLQQGEAARQTLPHLFLHVVPRKAGDIPRNDDIYGLLEEAVPLFDGAAAATEDGSARGTGLLGRAEDGTASRNEAEESVPEDVEVVRAQHRSCAVNCMREGTLSRAEVARQSQEMRRWLSKLHP